MSESQERMMAVVTPGDIDAFLAICAKWDVPATVIGEVTDTGRLVMTWDGSGRACPASRSAASAASLARRFSSICRCKECGFLPIFLFSPHVRRAANRACPPL